MLFSSQIKKRGGGPPSTLTALIIILCLITVTNIKAQEVLYVLTYTDVNPEIVITYETSNLIQSEVNDVPATTTTNPSFDELSFEPDVFFPVRGPDGPDEVLTDEIVVTQSSDESGGFFTFYFPPGSFDSFGTFNAPVSPIPSGAGTDAVLTVTAVPEPRSSTIIIMISALILIGLKRVLKRSKPIGA
jgi:hypothetical protein